MSKDIIKLTQKSKAYPRLLSHISDPPETLYCRGNLNLLNKTCFAVVGTRKLTPYGRETTHNIVRDLVNAGFVIVSGLALGIDAAAHQATLDWKGKTIAVLGGGISDKNIGPRTNLPLAHEILKNGGLLISEYSDTEEIFPINFAIRDRIISGLSKGVLIVEADEKSGSLITAQCALDQNRDVFAVPGSIFSSKSLGPHNLIKHGAKLVISGKDILDEYGPNLKLFDLPVNGQKSSISTGDAVQNAILVILNEGGTVFVDEIIRQSGEETSKVAAALSILEIKGIIKNIGNGKYKRV